MKLSKRLQAVAEQVTDTGVAADVGCDHGFTSIYLIETGRAERVIAMDIGKGPLLRAKEHIMEYQMEDRIELRQSDGVAQLEKGEVDTLLISGMGGQLICRILREGWEKIQEMKELVLSPQSNLSMVRKLVHEMGFCILRECMVFDAKKYYVILYAVPGQEKFDTEAEYLYGRYLLQKRDPVFLEYMKKEYEKVTEVIYKMEKSQLSEEGDRHLVHVRKNREQIMQILHKMGVTKCF